MTLKEFNEATEHLPDDTQIFAADSEYGDEEADIEIKQVEKAWEVKDLGLEIGTTYIRVL